MVIEVNFRGYISQVCHYLETSPVAFSTNGSVERTSCCT